MRYELYMNAALAEAARSVAAGERADGAVVVLDEAMVAGGHERTQETGDPTAHAPIVALREAARRLARLELSGATVYTVVEPCAMCVGAMFQSDVDGLVFALADPYDGACGSVLQLADSDVMRRRLRVVSGILQEEAADLRPDLRLSRTGAGKGVSAGH
jgi:tRNA(adenine34) deaminase